MWFGYGVLACFAYLRFRSLFGCLFGSVLVFIDDSLLGC